MNNTSPFDWHISPKAFDTLPFFMTYEFWSEPLLHLFSTKLKDRHILSKEFGIDSTILFLLSEQYGVSTDRVELLK